MSITLRSLPDEVIIARIRDLVGRERTVMLAVLDHLNEIRRRRLHLKLGHSSLFAYCTTALGYSSSAAGRRIQAAVCLARFPEVRALLQTGEVNVCTIAMVSRVLTPANRAEIFGRIRGQSQRNVQAIVAAYDPWQRVPRDRIVPVAVRAPVMAVPPLLAPTTTDVVESAADAAASAPWPSATAPVAARQSPATGVCESLNYSRSGSETSPVFRPTSPAGTGGAASSLETGTATTNVAGSAAALDPRFRIQFSASPAFMIRLERVRALASHRLSANPSLEQVFALALDYFIEREDATKRHERRERRAERRREQTPPPAAGPPGRRPIPRRIRDAVFARDRARCTYVGPDGARCESTHVVQVDHVHPVALGGGNAPDNLRLLCAHHNRYEAERLLGHPVDRGESV